MAIVELIGSEPTFEPKEEDKKDRGRLGKIRERLSRRKAAPADDEGEDEAAEAPAKKAKAGKPAKKAKAEKAPKREGREAVQAGARHLEVRPGSEEGGTVPQEGRLAHLTHAVSTTPHQGSLWAPFFVHHPPYGA
jgi:hypothetical protein